ncbi:substrate-binding domain-containing protein [Robbsia sp. Bb-Pol-6]|uniref:Substrate-binding domain-containing protein n=1 Tax=Robbsia betulipollinis TaxID=2981849 RepID=A0ABT3ZKA5_9BURK|nr:substrate-binding domain-containing protein [Robbsia betulipollinis]MCY0386715.1 substrate-binding domain-containing protein [Robbsia betulipollinis]
MRSNGRAARHVKFSIAVAWGAATLGPFAPAWSVEPARVFAAGSLVAAVNDALTSSGIAAADFAKPVFGPAGALRARLEAGEQADLFLSADLAQPRALARGHEGTYVVPFARNRMCLFSHRPLGANAADVVATLLAPDFRLASSTPKADPGGDYAFKVFAKADGVKPGATQVLEKKALLLLGSPNAMTPIAGKSPAASIFLSDRADALLYYCSNAADIKREVPDLLVAPLPAALDVPVVYGMALLSDQPGAERFALFLLSEKGQAIFSKYGLLPLSPAPDSL